MAQLRQKGDPPVFNTIIRQANQLATAAEYGGEKTLKQKWGYEEDLANYLEKLTEEVLLKLEG